MKRLAITRVLRRSRGSKDAVPPTGGAQQSSSPSQFHYPGHFTDDEPHAKTAPQPATDQHPAQQPLQRPRSAAGSSPTSAGTAQVSHQIVRPRRQPQPLPLPNGGTPAGGAVSDAHGFAASKGPPSRAYSSISEGQMGTPSVGGTHQVCTPPSTLSVDDCSASVNVRIPTHAAPNLS